MKFKSVVLTVAAIALLTGCSAKENPAQNAPPQSAMPQVAKAWNSDGVISDGEYTTKKMIGEIEVSTKVEGDSVMVAMKARTTGWMSLGIDPEDKMKGADIWMCYVKDGKAEVIDMYSTGPYGPHPADEKQGGKADVTMISVMQQDGNTIIEFKRKLETGDSKDKPLKMGENKVMWGVGDSSDPSMKHSRRGYGTLELK